MARYQAAAADLLETIRGEVEQGDGSWPGGDLVETVVAWIERQGVSTDEARRPHFTDGAACWCGRTHDRAPSAGLRGWSR